VTQNPIAWQPQEVHDFIIIIINSVAFSFTGAKAEGVLIRIRKLCTNLLRSEEGAVHNLLQTRPADCPSPAESYLSGRLLKKVCRVAVDGCYGIQSTY